ncbi:MAG: malto-oligosyltrehalose synthase [Thermomicrobiales bacterium]
MTDRYACIHGHFYQPPRENPWLEAIELQDSAYPYHDWNERITAECYAPNAASRILDGEERIARIVRNYASISFNFGPTLLAWMEAKAPDIYAAILAADRDSRARFSGHGAAMAQAYNHMILPLANRRDKWTQIRWGIADFVHRFGRAPEGMWLSETAVDLETLDILAEQGIAFTVLAPSQAGLMRETGTEEWEDVSGARIDPTRAYVQHLPSGRSIALFFYDGPISRGVAFEGLLDRGENLANRLLGAFSEERAWPQLVHIATDGETYGHHHAHGDMALAYALHHIESHDLARLTIYGEYLEMFPPTHAVEIIENTAWSCDHGVERWRSDCGCNTGGRPDWNQRWRGPLRAALDWLRDAVAPMYEAGMRDLVHDPWAARDAYIAVILDRSDETVTRFLSEQTTRDLTESERVRLWELLEMQRHAMLMYTSCGWFFDELSGIETVQVIQYAGRVIQLAETIAGEAFEPRFLDLLQKAKSNIREHRDGRHIYEKFVKPAVVDTEKLAAHYAISSLFDEYPEDASVYCYAVEREDYRRLEAGRAALVVGRARFTSRITGESAVETFGALSLGDHTISSGVGSGIDDEAYRAFVAQSTEAFTRVDFPEVIRALDRYFGESMFSLKTLFRDEQRKILDIVLDASLAEDAASYSQMYDRQAPLMRFVRDLHVPLPQAFQTAAAFLVNSDLRRELAAETLDRDRIRAILADAETWHVTLDTAGLSYMLRRRAERLSETLKADPVDIAPLIALREVVEVAHLLPFGIVFWHAQNIYYGLLQTRYREFYRRARRGDEDAQTWVTQFIALGEGLGMAVGETTLEEIRALPSVATVAREALERARIPRATYRLQFNRTFTFADAEALVAYLADLGISDVYASPLLKACAGSDHGYDICDHSQLNPEVGTGEEFDALAAALRARGLGLVFDMVPNHMGIADPSNVWWMDVLENGPSSLYAKTFDIDWHPVKRELANKVLLPILGDQYGGVLESGQLRLSYENGAFFLHYWDTVLPIAPHTYDRILGYRLDALIAQLGAADEHLLELESILTALGYLPATDETDAEKMAERHREKEVIKRRIATLCDASPEIRESISAALDAFNAADEAGIEMLDDLLDVQPYRPAFWRVAAEEINYRRFFDVNQLAAIRVELPEVFKATHDLVFRLLAEGKATSLRIDHPDGLWDPPHYFRQLQEQYLLACVRARMPEHDAEEAGELEAAVRAWFDAHIANDGERPPQLPLYVVAEKILTEGETLPEEWLVAGTTGYDFLNDVNGLFVDARNRKAIDEIYARFTGNQTAFTTLTNANKKMIMLISLASEINALAYQLERISERNRSYRDFTLNSLTFAIREVIACLPVYRTYTTDTTATVTQHDVRYVEAAVAEAKRRNPRTASQLFDFLRDTLLLRNVESFRAEDRPRLIEFVMKFQQITGPVMAKGVEDTAFYVYNRLVSLNEVGGHPVRFGLSVPEFHARNAERARRWPHTMLASSTHDTKRSEDVRARIDVLSEMSEEWRAALNRWGRMNARAKSEVAGDRYPDRNAEYLLYQTLLGAWPTDFPTPEAFGEFRERIVAYMLKAAKEAKIHTSWINPNDAYDRALQEFVAAVLVEGERNAFLADFAPLQRRVAFFGQWNALAQEFLKLTSPGVPDIYQGTELWDYSLVDPDNRRPVDYDRRRAILADLREHADCPDRGVAFAHELMESSDDGRIKLFIVSRTLDFRRTHDALFTNGFYVPLDAQGAKADHVCAFARTDGDDAAIVVAPRLVVGLTGGEERPPLGPDIWGDTWLTLPPEYAGRHYRNIFTGEELAVTDRDGTPGLLLAALCAYFPLALLAPIAG